MKDLFLEGINVWENLWLEELCKEELWEEEECEEEETCQEEACEALFLLQVGLAVLEVILHKKLVIMFYDLIVNLFTPEY